ncbi:hypothetical protein K8Z61_10695 [Nocardioides sp. TRM66260-LWL]|uniref:hypothetical protein n=1 Tax=Nocardioides sp. TRM66260-LWL TaxID=2874478 RepID=UPI001CC7E791|nr:hypothetical protein [Nocardioides sp. TRM66260-LWL]MBZ5734965.1 hypothetical protein [Nocardioides sp. TRM66260-LWL]
MSGQGDQSDPSGASAVWQRGTWDDLLVDDAGESLVLVGDQVARLSVLGTLLLELLASPRTSTELATLVVERLGEAPPAEVEAALDAALEALAGLGVVRAAES